MPTALPTAGTTGPLPVMDAPVSEKPEWWDSLFAETVEDEPVIEAEPEAEPEIVIEAEPVETVEAAPATRTRKRQKSRLVRKKMRSKKRGAYVEKNDKPVRGGNEPIKRRRRGGCGCGCSGC